MDMTMPQVIGILGAKLAEKELEIVALRMEVERLTPKPDVQPTKLAAVE